MEFSKEMQGIASLETTDVYQEYIYHVLREQYEQKLELNFAALKEKCDKMAESSILRTPTMLIYGPRWTGKTLMVRRLAAHAKVPLIHVQVRCLMAVPIEQAIRCLSLFFDFARNTPSILCFEDLDLMCPGLSQPEQHKGSTLIPIFKDEISRLKNTTAVVGITKSIKTVDLNDEIASLFTLKEELPLFDYEDSCTLVTSVCHSVNSPDKKISKLLKEFRLKENQTYLPKILVRETFNMLLQ